MKNNVGGSESVFKMAGKASGEIEEAVENRNGDNGEES